MWVPFSILSMLMLTAADIVSKKAVAADDLAPIKLRIPIIIIVAILSLFIYYSGFGESGLAPWTLAQKYPIILVTVFCFVFSEFFFVLSLRYIGMSIMEVISGFEGIIICFGLLIYNSLSGQLNEVQDMLMPARLVFICIILILTFLLPNIKTIENRKSIIAAERLKKKHYFVIGILIAFWATINEAVGSLVNDTMLGTGSIGAIDYLMTVYFLSIILLPVFCIALYLKCKHTNSSRKILGRYTILYTILDIVQGIVGLIALSIDAVRSEIMYLTYPVVSIVGARIILKEKHTWKQSVCIWGIVLATIAFCAIDYII